MPGYRAHLVGGAAAYGLTLLLLRSSHISVFLATEWLLFALIGSLFPDIDTKSKGQNILYKLLFVIMIVLALQRKFIPMSIVGFFAIIPIVVKHRGLFHRFWFVIGLPLGAAALISLYAPAYSKIILFDALFFIMGAISHLFLDFVIKRG